MSKLSNRLTALEKSIIWGVLAILVYIPFHAPVSVALGTLTHQPLLIKAWKEIFLLLLVVAVTVVLVKRSDIRKPFIRSRINQLVLAFILWQLALAVFYHGSLTATFAGLDIDIRFSVFFLVVRFAALLTADFMDRMTRLSAYAAVCVIGFGVLQQYILPRDVLKYLGYSKSTISPYLTVDNNLHYIRINSTMRGPNPLGVYAVTVLSFIAGWIEKFRRSLTKKQWTVVGLAVLATLSVLYASYSRSAWVALVIAAAAYALVSLSRRAQLYVVIGLVVLSLIGVASYPSISHSNFWHTIIDHKDPNNPSGVDSNLGHASSLADGLKDAAKQPFGGGIGSTGSASLTSDKPLVIENQYLFVAHEAGWIGAGLFIVMQAAVLVGLYRFKSDWRAKALFASGLGLVFVCLTLPALTDDPTAYLWWGLAAGALSVKPAGKRHGKSSK